MVYMNLEKNNGKQKLIRQVLKSVNFQYILRINDFKRRKKELKSSSLVLKFKLNTLCQHSNLAFLE